MSVLIKDMEMPEHCGYCRFRYDGICHALQKTQYATTDCPLVSVPVQPEIIRCKDCKHRPEKVEESDEYDMDTDLEFPDEVCPCQCDDYYYSWMPKDDWFCASGERKEE